MKMPLSTTIKEFVNRNSYPNSEDLKSLASSVLLSEEEVRLWVDHIATVIKNRKRGTTKAVATRLAKKKQAVCVCGACEEPYICGRN